MSLAEIKDAVTDLTPEELAELAAFIQAQDKTPWDREIEEDFAPGRKHQETLEKIDAAASQEDWPEFPVFDGGPVDGALARIFHPCSCQGKLVEFGAVDDVRSS